MSNLRKAAQDDALSAPPLPTTLIDVDTSRVWGIAWQSAIEQMRKHSAMQAEHEPVATVACDTKAGATAFCYFSKDVAAETPLYTAPPSVGALIADVLDLAADYNVLEDFERITDKYRIIK